MARDLPAIKIVRTTFPNLGGGAAVEERLSVKPVTPGVWDEFLALQIWLSPLNSVKCSCRYILHFSSIWTFI